MARSVKCLLILISVTLMASGRCGPSRTALRNIDDLARISGRNVDTVASAIPESRPWWNDAEIAIRDVAARNEESVSQTRTIVCQVLSEAVENDRVPDSDDILKAWKDEGVSIGELPDIVNSSKVASAADNAADQGWVDFLGFVGNACNLAQSGV